MINNGLLLEEKNLVCDSAFIVKNGNEFFYSVDIESLEQTLKCMYNFLSDFVFDFEFNFDDNTMLIKDNLKNESFELDFMLIGQNGKIILYDTSCQNIDNISQNILSGVFNSDFKQLYQD